MGNSMTLASKYRPKKFEDIVEQDSIKKILNNQIETNNLKHAYLFCGSAGTGKAQPLNSLILTPNGYKKMGDIKVGDKVIDGKGKSTKVTDIFPQGKKSIYRISFNDNTSVLCSDEHLWKLRKYEDEDKEENFSVIELSTLIKGKDYKKDRFVVPTPIIKCWKDNDLELSPYLIGLFLLNNVTENKYDLSSLDTDIIDEINTNLAKYDLKLFWKKREEDDEDYFPYYKIVDSVSNEENIILIQDLLKDSKIEDYISQKKIPHNYLFSKIETRVKLLKMFIKIKGSVCVDDKQDFIQVKLQDKNLSDDFAFLVRSLGGIDKVVELNDEYIHIVKFNIYKMPKTLYRFFNKVFLIQQKLGREIVNIEYAGEQECQCIMVASEDHTYITDNVTVTHNTTTARIVANRINDYKVKPIELDCASHNGVDDVRNIIDDCKTRPLVGKYKTYVLDEVQVMSNAAWSAMLKILEEPPEYVVFIMCTTNPEKILNTILSRVQRFNFARISNEGIEGRLKYIVQNENIERINQGKQQIIIDQNAINYIARLAKGGMRDAVTTLEKCLDYSLNLSLDNVLEVTSGGLTENVLLELMTNILKKDCKSALLLFNKIYMSGVDVTLFLKMWTEYLQNCIKYLVTGMVTLTTLSDFTINELDSNPNIVDTLRVMLNSILQINNRYSTDDLKILVESWIIELCNI